MTVTTKIGFGEKVSGEIVVVERAAGTGSIDEAMAGKILLFSSWVPRAVLEKAGLIGVAGVVVPSMHWRDFDYFAQISEFPMLILLKFGMLDLSKELRDKLSKLGGKKGTLDGEKKTITA